MYASRRELKALRRELIQRIDALDRLMTTSAAQSQRAEEKADVAQVKKFESLNEMREMAKDVGERSMPRVEADVRFDRVKERLDRHDKEIAEMMAKSAGIKAGWGWAAAVIALAMAIAALYSMSRGAGG